MQVTESPPDNQTLQPATPDTESVIAEIHHEPHPAVAAISAPPCLVARTGLQQDHNQVPSVRPSSLAAVESRQSDIAQHCKRAREAHMSQAERIVKCSRVGLKAGEVGDNVAVPIPMVDSGRMIHVTSWGSSLTVVTTTYTPLL